MEPLIKDIQKPSEGTFQAYFDTKKDHLLPAAFINPSMNGIFAKNTFGAYLRMAEVAYLRRQIFSQTSQPFEYNFANEVPEKILTDLAPFYTLIQTNPVLEYPFGLEIPNGTKVSYYAPLIDIFTAYEATPSEKLKVQEYIDGWSTLASPLFEKVIKSPNDSISIVQLFDMAMQTGMRPFDCREILPNQAGMTGSVFV